MRTRLHLCPRRLCLAAAGIILLLLWVVRFRQQADTPPPPPVPPATQPDISLSRIHHESSTDGVLQWELTAASADYSTNEHQAAFKGIVLKIRMDTEWITATATQGTLDTATSEIQLFGDVHVTHPLFALETASLQYRHNNAMILTHSPVRIYRQGMECLAASMIIDLTRSETRLSGKVRGHFSYAGNE